MALPAPRTDQTYVTVAAIDGGRMTLPERYFIDPADPNKGVMVPSLAFLITHPGGKSTQHKAQRLLFDLGLRCDARDYTADQQKHIETRQPYHLGPGVLKHLEDGGISATDIDMILFSHVHWDHTGDPHHFPASRFKLGPGSLQVLDHGLRGKGSHQHFDPNLLPRDRTSELPSISADNGWSNCGPFPATFDLFGDGSVLVVDAPGHLPGHINLLCRTSSSTWVCLCGDSYHDARLRSGECQIACWDAEGEEGQPITLSIHLDVNAAAESIDRLRQIATLDGVEVIAAHEAYWLEENQHRLFPQTL